MTLLVLLAAACGGATTSAPPPVPVTGGAEPAEAGAPDPFTMVPPETELVFTLELRRFRSWSVAQLAAEDWEDLISMFDEAGELDEGEDEALRAVREADQLTVFGIPARAGRPAALLSFLHGRPSPAAIDTFLRQLPDDEDDEADEGAPTPASPGAPIPPAAEPAPPPEPVRTTRIAGREARAAGSNVGLEVSADLWLFGPRPEVEAALARRGGAVPESLQPLWERVEGAAFALAAHLDDDARASLGEGVEEEALGLSISGAAMGEAEAVALGVELSEGDLAVSAWVRASDAAAGERSREVLVATLESLGQSRVVRVLGLGPPLRRATVTARGNTSRIDLRISETRAAGVWSRAAGIGTAIWMFFDMMAGAFAGAASSAPPPPALPPTPPPPPPAPAP